MLRCHGCPLVQNLGQVVLLLRVFRHLLLHVGRVDRGHGVLLSFAVFAHLLGVDVALETLEDGHEVVKRELFILFNYRAHTVVVHLIFEHLFQDAL